MMLDSLSALCFRRTQSLDVLLHVLHPTCSIWPRKYVQLSTNTIPLQMLIEDLVSGQIELRTPEEHLRLLLAQRGCWTPNICVSAGPSLWLRSLWWWWLNSAVTRRSDGKMITSIGLQFRTPTNTNCNPLSVLPTLLPTLPSQLVRKLAIAETLDSIPHAHMEAALLEFQSAIPPESLALLEFTGCERALSVWNNTWVLSALPFFYSSKTQKRPRTLAPFTNTLPSVVTALESGTRRCTILSVQNVSLQYAQLLNDYARTLEKRDTMERWTGERLWARWEAACYASGVLTRWVICARSERDGLN